MQFKETTLKGSYILELEKRSDERGFFARFFCKNEFANFNLNTEWVQINNSLSKEAGTLRGLHFQRRPHSEIKIVRCIQGAIWDVIVDIRKDSSTFGKWFGVELNSENRKMLYVPKGFAHGFITLKANTEIFYLVSDFYAPEAENTLLWNDPVVSIDWPISPTVISEKDKLGKCIFEVTI